MSKSIDLGSAHGKIELDHSDVKKNTREASEHVHNMGNSFSQASMQIGMAGAAIAATGAGIAAALASGLNEFIQFESSFTGVRKTVNATEAEFKALEDQFRSLSKQIPVDVNELNKFGESAGQLGIQKENIADFVRVIADLGETTNLAGDEGATTMARFANIVQMNQKNFSRLGSTVVELGNNLATTEAEIMHMGLRLAGAGKQIGLSESQILSFAGALSSVGIEAEAGGSAMSKVFIKLATAGGKELDTLAKVAGMTGVQFKKTFKEDATSAIIAFVEGLGKMQAEGKDVFAVLEELEITEVRMRDALLRSAGAGDVMRKSVKLGSKAWKENSALTEEAKKRYETLESKVQVAKNKLQDMGITIGAYLAPYLQWLIGHLTGVVDWFNRLSPATQKTIVVVAALAAGLLLLVGGIMTAIGVIGLMAGGFAALATAIGISTGALFAFALKLALATAGISLVVGGLVLLAYNLKSTSEQIEEGKRKWEEYQNALHASENAELRHERSLLSQKRALQEQKTAVDNLDKIRKDSKSTTEQIRDAELRLEDANLAVKEANLAVKDALIQKDKALKDSVKAGEDATPAIYKLTQAFWAQGKSIPLAKLREYNELMRKNHNLVPRPGGTSTIMPIPKMAKGGIVTKPTLALIGEAGPEAVVPLGSTLSNIIDGRSAGSMAGMAATSSGRMQSMRSSIQISLKDLNAKLDIDLENKLATFVDGRIIADLEYASNLVG